MGSAILSGILDATRSSDSPSNSKISQFIVATKTTHSAERLRSTFIADEARIRFLPSQPVRAMKDADIILLACKPYMAEGILAQEGVREALAGKFVISVLAGKTTQELLGYIYDDQQQLLLPRSEEGKTPFIVRTQPNVAARLRQSMTIIESPEPELPARLSEVLVWIFEKIGGVKFLPADLFNTGTMLVGASMGLLTVPLEGMLDGGVAEGMRRADGVELVAQALEGLAGLLKSGAHPSILRENIASPRGCTIQGVMRLEREGARGTFAQAVIDGVKHLDGDRK